MVANTQGKGRTLKFEEQYGIRGYSFRKGLYYTVFSNAETLPR
jgi:hypothetical protein